MSVPGDLQLPEPLYTVSLRPAERRRLAKTIAFTLVKWRWLLVGLPLVCAAIAFVVMYLRPPAYTASAKILLQGDRPRPPQVLGSEVARFRSRTVLRPVARAVLPANEVFVDGGDTEEMVDVLIASTTARAIPETNLILVGHHSATPESALKRLRLIIDAYMAAHVEENRASRTLLELHTREQQRAARDLKEAEAHLHAWRQANNVHSVETAVAQQVPILADRQRALEETESDISSTKAKIASVTHDLQRQPERLMLMREHVPNPLIATLQTDLAAAQTKAAAGVEDVLVTELKKQLLAEEKALGDLRQRYADKHRLVEEKQQQVEAVKAALARTEADVSRAARQRVTFLRDELTTAQEKAEIVGTETFGLNPMYEALKKELGTAQAQLASLESRRQVVEDQVHKSTALLESLRAKRLEEDRLSRAVALNDEAVKLHARKLEEVRVAADAESKPLMALSVIEQPYLEADSRLVWQVAGTFLASAGGVLLALGIVFGYETFSNRLRVPDDVEHHLALPLLASIPRREIEAKDAVAPSAAHSERVQSVDEAT